MNYKTFQFVGYSDEIGIVREKAERFGIEVTDVPYASPEELEQVRQQSEAAMRISVYRQRGRVLYTFASPEDHPHAADLREILFPTDRGMKIHHPEDLRRLGLL